MYLVKKDFFYIYQSSFMYKLVLSLANQNYMIAEGYLNWNLQICFCKYLNKDSKKEQQCPFLIFGFKVPFLNDFSEKVG